MPDSVISILSISVVGGPYNLGMSVVSPSVNTEDAGYRFRPCVCVLDAVGHWRKDTIHMLTM